MVVKIEEIPQEGLALNEPIARAVLDDALTEQGRDTGFRARGEARLSARLHKVSGGVLLEGAFDAELTALCKRCLADVPLTVPVSFTLNLVPEGLLHGETAPGEDDEHGERAGSFDLGEADHDVFDGKKIELDPILREQVLLALPISVVCRDDCRGLCSVCGQNLNERECGCERKVLDPRLAALKDIKL
ncbi:MAG: YceD family protein [Myxococcota bacterium]